MTEDGRQWGPNPGYALGQLARALTTEQEHEDEATRQRAVTKVGQWHQVLQGLLSGALAVGSRTPVKNVPAWATLRVVTGGFATGDLMAGGALEPHEEEWLSRFPDRAEGRERATLNAYFLCDEGIRDLQDL